MAESDWRYPLGSAVLLGLSYCFPLFVTNFIALVPLLLWLDRAVNRPTARIWRATLLFGWVTHLITQHWIYVLAGWTWLAWLLYAFFAGVLGIRVAVGLRWLVALRRRWNLPYALLLPVSWIPLEWLQSFGDLRMTGEHLAHTLSRYPFFVQFADLVGPYGVTFVLLAINGAIADLWLAPALRRRRMAATLAMALAAILAYDAWAWWRPVEDNGRVRVGLIQPDVPLDTKMNADKTAAEQSRLLAALSRRASEQGAELIVWPESARPYPVHHWLDRPETLAVPEVATLAKSLHAGILFGVEYARIRTPEDFDYYNAALAVGSDGQVIPEWSAKKYLVPFVEKMPFREWLGPLLEGKSGEWRWIMGAFEEGPQTVIHVEGVPIGVVVCYEQLFSDLPRRLNRLGAEVQVVITNDAWFGRTLLQRFQANALRLRAIENRREFVRVANTGISGFVDRRGSYFQQTKLFEEAVEVRDVRRFTALTLYNRIGNVVAWICALLLSVGLLFRSRRRPRTEGS